MYIYAITIFTYRFHMMSYKPKRVYNYNSLNSSWTCIQ